MISRKTIGLIFEKTDSRYKETRLIWILLTGLVLMGFIIIFFNQEKEFLVLLKLIILSFTITILGLLFFFLFINGIRKLTSTKIICTFIDDMSSFTWRLGRELSYKKIMELHPSVMKHPVTIYVLGQILLKEGYYNEGKQLINKAKEMNSYICKIQMNDSLNQEDAKSLIDLLTSSMKVTL